MIKQDPGRPTLNQLKKWISRKNWISERNVGTDFFQRLRIPLAKVERLAAEAKTLDAARMRELEPHKRYTLAVALLCAQFAKTIDDIGEMYIKRVASSHTKSEKSLNELKEKREKQIDGLAAVLRDAVVAYQSEGSAEQRLKALEKVIGGNRGLLTPITNSICPSIGELEPVHPPTGQNGICMSKTCCQRIISAMGAMEVLVTITSRIRILPYSVTLSLVEYGKVFISWISS